MKRGIALVLGLGVMGYLILRASLPSTSVIEQHEPYRNPTQNATLNEAQAPTTSVPKNEGEVVKVANEEPGPELKSELEKVTAALPTLASLKRMKEEDVAHRAPHQVVEAGAALGDLAEYLDRHPSEFKSATPFYANCALNETLLPSARALCLNTLQKKPAEWAQGVKESLERVPDEIKGLSADLD